MSSIDISLSGSSVFTSFVRPSMPVAITGSTDSKPLDDAVTDVAISCLKRATVFYPKFFKKIREELKTFEFERNLEEEYILLEKIGFGAYAKVYRARTKSDGRIVAIKKFKHNTEAAYEQKMYRSLHGIENFVMPIDFVIDSDKAAIVFPLVEGPTLDESIRERDEDFNVEQVFLLAREAFCVLAQLHKRGLIHCDISGGNVFFENGFHLIDAGLMAYNGFVQIGLIPYSECYRPIEAWLENYNYFNSKMDVAALGFLLISAYLRKEFFVSTKRSEEAKKLAYLTQITAEIGEIPQELIASSFHKTLDRFFVKMDDGCGNITYVLKKPLRSCFDRQG